jgi:hypothetical protein
MHAQRFPRPLFIVFFAYLAFLGVAAGLLVWQSWAIDKAWKTERAERRRLEQASIAFYNRFSNIDGGTRAELEAQLPDPKPIGERKYLGYRGETISRVTYREPATRGELVVNYSSDGRLSVITTGYPEPIRKRPPLVGEVVAVRRCVSVVEPWIWTAALVALLFISMARIKQCLALVMIALALTYATAQIARGGDIGYAYWAAFQLLICMWVTKHSFRLRPPRDPSRCAACGYDLRATPNRCPECGTVPTA